MAESKFLIKFSNVNRDKYIYRSPVTTKQGCVECKCEYMRDGGKTAPFFFETPRLITAKGIYNLDGRFYLDIMVPMSCAFLDWLLAEDEKNIGITAENSDSWFGEQSSIEEISQGYKTSLIFRSKGDEPILRVNIPTSRGKPVLEVFDNNKRPVDISAVIPGVEIACIMEKMPLRFYRDKFTGEYQIYKLKVCSDCQVAKLPPGYIFSQSDEEDGSEEGSESEAGTESEGSESEAGTESEEESGSQHDSKSGSDVDDLQLESGEDTDIELNPEDLEISGEEDNSIFSPRKKKVEDPLAVSGDEDELDISGEEDEEEEPFFSRLNKKKVEDPLAVSGDEDVSGEEDEEEEPFFSRINKKKVEDPLAVSGDEDVSGDDEEEEPINLLSEDELEVSGEEDNPFPIPKGKEDILDISGDEEDDFALSEDEHQSEFGISEGGDDEILVQPTKLTLQPEELTESDLELEF